MLLRFARTTGAQIILFILFIGFLLWLPPLMGIHSVGVNSLPEMPIYRLITGWISNFSHGSAILAFLIIIGLSFGLVQLNTIFILINNRTYLPALFFMLITSVIPANQCLQPAVIGCVFLVFAVRKIFDSYHRTKIAHEIFQAAFLIAIGSLIYPPLVFFLLIVWVGLIVLRPFQWREWLFSIFGFTTPMLFVFSYYYLVRDNPSGLYLDYWTYFQVKAPKVNLGWSEMFLVGYFLFLIAVSSLSMFRFLQSLKILPRKAFVVFFWLFATTALIYSFIPQVSLEIIYLAAIPMSFLLGQYFSNAKAERWANILLLLTFLIFLISRLNLIVT